MAYHLRGFIVSDSEKWLYDWFGIQCSTPGDIKAWLDSDDPEKLVTINSYGGDLFAAAEMFGDLAGKVDTEIVGLAASAAGIVAMAGKTVKMSALAEIMIHNVSTYTEGDYRDMQRAADDLEKANESVKAAYKYRSDVSDETLQSLMDRETWLTAQEAKEYGFVDEILHEQKNSGFDFKNAFKPALAFANALKCPAVKSNSIPKKPLASLEGAFDFDDAKRRLEIEKQKI